MQARKDEASHYFLNGKSVGGTFEQYQDAVVWAVQQRKEHKLSVREAVRRAKQEFGIDIAEWAVRSGKMGTRPARRGRPSIFDPEEEQKLVDIICMLRTMKVDLGMAEVMHIANQMMEGTDYAETWLHGCVTKDWYYAFLRRHRDRLGTGSAQGIEFDRARWSTADVVNRHYEIVEKLALDLGLAEPNPEYDETVAYNPTAPAADTRCQRVVWVKKATCSRVTRPRSPTAWLGDQKAANAQAGCLRKKLKIAPSTWRTRAALGPVQLAALICKATVHGLCLYINTHPQLRLTRHFRCHPLPECRLWI
jgi:hypothetical protein